MKNIPGEKGELWVWGCGGTDISEVVPIDLHLFRWRMGCPAQSSSLPGALGSVEESGVEQVWVNPGQRDLSETSRQKGKLCGGLQW